MVSLHVQGVVCKLSLKQARKEYSMEQHGALCASKTMNVNVAEHINDTHVLVSGFVRDHCSSSWKAATSSSESDSSI